MPDKLLDALIYNMRWSKAIRYIGFLFWSTFVAAGAGIVGNRADAQFLKVIWPSLSDQVAIPFWLIVVVILLSTTLIVGLLFLFVSEYQKVKFEYQDLEKANYFLADLNNLDDTFCRLLTQIDIVKDTDKGLKQLLRAYWKEVFDIFDATNPQKNPLDKCHVVIYRPDSSNSEYLKPWFASIHAPSRSEAIYRFPTQPVSGQKPGIAGKVYMHEELYKVCVARVFKNKETGVWESDDLDYIFFEEGYSPGHRAVAAIPLVDDSSSDNQKIGVLCFYSMDEYAFDAKNFQKVLLPMFSRRVSAAIQIEKKLC